MLYNQAVFLSEAIESVLAQTYPRFEVVVVDDGSTDNTEETARHYPGVQCLRQENQGLAVARNNGFQQSRGDYVVFLDADDRLLPRALEAGLAGFRAHPDCVLVAGHCRLINHDGTPLMASSQPCIERDHYARLLAECYIYPPATVMYRRSILAAVAAGSIAASVPVPITTSICVSLGSGQSIATNKSSSNTVSTAQT